MSQHLLTSLWRMAAGKIVGAFIVDAWMRINYLEMYAGIVVLSMTGFLLFLLTDLSEATLCKWKFNN